MGAATTAKMIAALELLGQSSGACRVDGLRREVRKNLERPAIEITPEHP